MKISQNSIQSATSRVAAATPAPTSAQPKDSVTFDKSTNTYEINVPGLHRTIQKANPFLQGVKVAGVVAVPMALGAAQSALLGVGLSTVATAFLSPTIGAVAGAALTGRGAYKMSDENVMFGARGAVVGGGIGAVALPILELPGVWLGATGAAVAAGAVGVGVALFQAHLNRQADEVAASYGYKPQG